MSLPDFCDLRLEGTSPRNVGSATLRTTRKIASVMMAFPIHTIVAPSFHAQSHKARKHDQVTHFAISLRNQRRKLLVKLNRDLARNLTSFPQHRNDFKPLIREQVEVLGTKSIE